jgi:hypothetical protein
MRGTNLQPQPIIADVVCRDCLAEDLRISYPGEELLCSECGGVMVPEAEISYAPHPAGWITLERLINKRACRSGRNWFSQNYPLGAYYYRVLRRLRATGREDWALWLEMHSSCFD